MSILLIAVLVILTAVVAWTWTQSPIKGIQRVGPSPGLFNHNIQTVKRDFQTNGQSIIKNGYKQYKDKNFVVQTLNMESIVIAPKFLPEVRMLPESKISHSVALVEKFLGYYSGVDVILESRQHANVCRLQLTQNLDKFVPRMYRACVRTKDQFLANFPPGVPVPAYGFVFTLVLNITSAVFVGEDLAGDTAWQAIVSDYLKEVVGTAKALKPYPKLIRPLMRLFVAPASGIESIYKRADQLLTQPILNRREAATKEVDVMTFLSQAQEQPDPRQIILQLLVLVSAALHTSTMAAVQALYDLCMLPNTALEIREEVVKELAKTGGSWSMETIRTCGHLDSFLKESFRTNQPESLGYSRIATSDFRLSDGTFVPQGTFLNMAAEAMSRDPQFYEDPEDFNSRRFYHPEKVTAQSNQSQDHEFAGIEKGNVAWGSGRSTCPGRWYASAMNKLIIGELLCNYEIALPNDQAARPTSIHDNGSIIPNPTQGLLFKPITV